MEGREGGEGGERGGGRGDSCPAHPQRDRDFPIVPGASSLRHPGSPRRPPVAGTRSPGCCRPPEWGRTILSPRGSAPKPLPEPGCPSRWALNFPPVRGHPQPGGPGGGPARGGGARDPRQQPGPAPAPPALTEPGRQRLLVRPHSPFDLPHGSSRSPSVPFRWSRPGRRMRRYSVTQPLSPEATPIPRRPRPFSVDRVLIPRAAPLLFADHAPHPKGHFPRGDPLQLLPKETAHQPLGT